MTYDEEQLKKEIDGRKKNQEELEAANKRLLSALESVKETAQNQERLETKMRLHRDWGQAILALRYYIYEGNGNLQEVLDKWRKNIAVIRSEDTEMGNQFSMERLKNAGKFAGIDISVSGEFPKEPNLLQLFGMAAVESLTNAVKHADAKELFIVIEKKKREYLICFYNDGTTPQEPISEGGGLSSLRKKVENAGGEMKIEWENHYRLRIKLPMKKENYYDEGTDC